MSGATVVAFTVAALTAWCVGGFVLAVAIGRSFARGEGADPHPAPADIALPDGSWLVRPAVPVDDVAARQSPYRASN